MALIKTEAIVLKSMNYRDRSKIVTLYTKSNGKLRAVAKGVRDVKTRWGGVLQPMAVLNTLIYYKENRTLHLVSGAEYSTSIRGIYENTDKMNTGFRIIELADKTTVDNHEIPGMFDLIADSLKMLNDATKNFVNLLFNFEFRAAKLLGFAIEMDSIDRNSSRLSDDFYSTGLHKDDSAALKKILRGKQEEITGWDLNGSSEIAIERFFEHHFNLHFENLSYSKTKKVIFSKEIRI